MIRKASVCLSSLPWDWAKKFYRSDGAKKYVPIFFFFGRCSVGLVPWAKKSLGLAGPGPWVSFVHRSQPSYQLAIKNLSKLAPFAGGP